MRPTRIVLADLPAPLRELVLDAVHAQPDLVVVADRRGEVDLLLDARDADVVIVAVGADGAGMATAERVLDVNSDLAVLAVDWGVRRAWLCRRELTRQPLPEQSLHDLAGTIRGIARRLADPEDPCATPREDR